MKKLFPLIGGLLLLCVSLTAGNIKGTVKSKDTNTTLPNAQIQVLGTEIRVVANVDGTFAINNLADGSYKIRATFAGFAPQVLDINVSGDTDAEFLLSPSGIDEEITVTANRAVVRETPVAFSNVTGEALRDKYTTQDVPELLKNVPGVFSRSSGLGEADLFVRGFDSEHVQIMINNVPVNDPESQVVYWSNWTGLSGNANSIQVQRGVGSSLYGSGAFGGSVNIETDNFSVLQSFGLNMSGGMYGGASDNSNYNLAFDYSTGYFHNDKMNFYFRYERKAGDYYIDGTNYDGHSYYFGLLYQISDKQSLTFNLHGAPQKHNQAANVQDPVFLEEFGRTWNRRNHPFQENYYHKPVFEIHHDLIISSDAFLRSTFFATMGNGGGKYLRNDKLIENEEVRAEYSAARNVDYQLGEVTYLDSGYFRNNRDYDPGSIYYNGFRSNSKNNHVQWGANTSFKKVFNPNFTLVTGGEIRFWNADHYSLSENFYFGANDHGGLPAQIVDEVERRYDYDGKTTNGSVYARLQWSPIPEVLTVMIDGQQNYIKQSVDENPIRQYDFYNRAWTDIYKRASMDILSGWDASNGVPTTSTVSVVANPDADPSLYERTYDFFQPKFGVNYNVNKNWNIFANYSQAKKEPKVGDWYNRTSVPLSDDQLKAEDLKDLELGFGYHSANVAFMFNYYKLKFENKIESVTDSNGDRQTLNAGNADMDGMELSLKWQINDNFTWNSSATLADNKWTSPNPNIDEIFYLPADSIIGKYVPGSPQTMYFTELAYNNNAIHGYINYNFWDDYYVTYDNTNFTYKGVEMTALNSDSTLPEFMEINVGFGYDFKLSGDSTLKLMLRANNITGHKHYNNAYVGSDYGRLSSGPYLGVTQSPEENYWLNLAWQF